MNVRGVIRLFVSLALASILACTPEAKAPSGSVQTFKLDVLTARDALRSDVVEAITGREPTLAKARLAERCVLAASRKGPFRCGVTVLDRNGLALASASAAEPGKRLDYSRYDMLMSGISDGRPVKTRLFLQDRTTLFVVGLPVHEGGRVVALLVLAFDGSELGQYGISEKEFMELEF